MQFRNLDSPEQLFQTMSELEEAVSRESREIIATSPLHASGIFGQFARCAVLAFKESSFEQTVKLYDAIQDYVDEFDSDLPSGKDHSVADIPKADIEMLASDGPAHDGSSSASFGDIRCAIAKPQIEQFAQGFMQKLRLSFGNVPFPVFDAALASVQEKIRSSKEAPCNVVHFLRYLNSTQHRMADAAGSLRAFHDGHQRGVGWLPPEDGLPDLVQHASLALAGLHFEVRHLDDALQAIGESIRVAQEASDSSCLCGCLYMQSLVLLQAGHYAKAFARMRRCLHRAEALGLPMLQALCCLSIARMLTLQPSLSDRRKCGLLWKESISRMAAETPAVVLRPQGAASFPSASNATSASARAFGFSGSGGGGGVCGGLGVLAALLGHSRDSKGGDNAATQGACRDAFAHVALASQLSTQVGALGETRPQVFLCQAEVARLFGLQALAASSIDLLLETYRNEMGAEDNALAMCQLVTAASEWSIKSTAPLLQKLSRQLPHATHLWGHIVGPRVIHMLIRAGESVAATALLFQVAGLLRAVSHGSATNASERFCAAANAVRLYHGQLFSAHRSARGAVECGTSPADVCVHLLCLTDVHLEAQDPIGALVPCLRCLSAAENARLLQFRAEALVRLARVKLEMRDYAGSLQITEDVMPQVIASGSAWLHGEVLSVQADVLFALMDTCEEEGTCERLLTEAVAVLRRAIAEFAPVAELVPLMRCHYLLARACHQLGDSASRNHHAKCFRHLVAFSEGHGEWPETGGTSGTHVPSDRSPEPSPVEGQMRTHTGSSETSLGRLLWRETQSLKHVVGEAGTEGASADAAKVPVALGRIHAVYPLAAILGA